MFDLRQNKALGTLDTDFERNLELKKYSGDEVANIVLNKYGEIDYEWGIKNASTDFVRRHLYLISSTNVFSARREISAMVCNSHSHLNNSYSDH